MGLEICTICVNYLFWESLGNSSSKWGYKEVEGLGIRKGSKRGKAGILGFGHVALRGCDNK